jgi:class 3 adenylate cyclase
VNTCARLEELTPAGEVWLTEDAVNAVGAPALGELVRVGDVVLRGRHGTTGLWRMTR